MILTGREIRSMQLAGRIVIDPFNIDQINPNSYNYRLGPILGVPSVGEAGGTEFTFLKIPEDGYVLSPQRMYLGHTFEKLGSDTLAMSLIGRSSLGRLGLFLQVSANLGHTGSCHNWTLEIVAAKSLRVYPYMKIGQISFWRNYGLPRLYAGGYSLYDAPHVSVLEMQEPRAIK